MSADQPAPTRRRGRPTSAEGPPVTRQQIIDAALRSLARNGYAGLSLRGLARELGVSLATVQRHVPTKDDLWRAAVDATLPSEMPDPSEAADPREGFRLAIQSIVERAARQPGVTAAVWNDTAPGAAERLDYLVTRIRDTLDEAAERLDRAVAIGLARPVEPAAVQALAGLGITSVVSSPEAMRRLFDVDITDAEQLDPFVDALVDLLLYGILRRDPPDPT